MSEEELVIDELMGNNVNILAFNSIVLINTFLILLISLNFTFIRQERQLELKKNGTPRIITNGTEKKKLAPLPPPVSYLL